jgi:glycosyltransferase involved in cell wall biosynthesis
MPLKGWLKTAKNLYNIRKQNKTIDAQKNDASYIFDSLIQKTPIDEILKNITAPISKEISSILKKIKKIGYITLSPLTQPPTVSIIIPHYNHYPYLDEALFHLTKQTILPDEVIVVDDHSDDKEKLQSVIDSYSKKLNLKLISPPQKAYAGGCRQFGAERATSNIVSMHDADDISHPSRIKLTKYFFKKHPDTLQVNFGLVRFKNPLFSYIKNFSPNHVDQNIIITQDIIQSMRQMFTNQRFSVFGKPEIKIGCYGHNGNYFWGCHSGHVTYRKDLSKIIKWTTPHDYVFTKYEDYEFNFLLFLTGQKSLQIDLPLVYYRIGTSTNRVDYKI